MRDQLARTCRSELLDHVRSKWGLLRILGLEARGHRSKVVERIEGEEASARLTKAAEVGRVPEASRKLRASALDLPASVAAARQASQQGKSPDAIQSEAREKWLKYRDQQAEQGKGKGSETGHSQERDRTRDKARTHTPDDDFSL